MAASLFGCDERAVGESDSRKIAGILAGFALRGKNAGVRRFACEWRHNVDSALHDEYILG